MYFINENKISKRQLLLKSNYPDKLIRTTDPVKIAYLMKTKAQLCIVSLLRRTNDVIKSKDNQIVRSYVIRFFN